MAGEGGIMDNTYGEALIENQVVHHFMISLIFINPEVFRNLFSLYYLHKQGHHSKYYFDSLVVLHCV